MDSSTFDPDNAPVAAGPVGQSLAGEVRATMVLFALVVLVTVGFALGSTMVLRLLAS